mmetsp:Transcript_21477/g.31966  ORF Transcript_21477/g.31966 Transcript_21477/m.31966 type:complete len:200 (+) Transcript_21477:207-806(+)
MTRKKVVLEIHNTPCASRLFVSCSCAKHRDALCYMILEFLSHSPTFPVMDGEYVGVDMISSIIHHDYAPRLPKHDRNTPFAHLFDDTNICGRKASLIHGDETIQQRSFEVMCSNRRSLLRFLLFRPLELSDILMANLKAFAFFPVDFNAVLPARLRRNYRPDVPRGPSVDPDFLSFFVHGVWQLNVELNNSLMPQRLLR